MSTSGIDRHLAEAQGQEQPGYARSAMGAPSPQQLDMLRDPETGKLPNNVFQRARKAGRPPESPNKHSGDLAKLIVHKYGDPADALGNVMAMDWATLRELWRQAQEGEAKHKPVAMKDVAKFWLECVRELMDRVHGKPTQKVEVGGKLEHVLYAPSLMPKSASAALEAFEQKLKLGVTADDIRLLESEIQDAEYTEIGPDDV